MQLRVLVFAALLMNSARAVTDPLPLGNPVAFASPDFVFEIALSRDGRSLAVSARDQKLRVWDVESGRLLFSASATFDRGLAFSPNGQLLAQHMTDQLLLRDATTGQITRQLPIDRNTKQIAFAGENTLACYGDNLPVTLLDLTANTRIALAGTKEDVHCLAGSDDVVFGCAGLGLARWDAHGRAGPTTPIALPSALPRIAIGGKLIAVLRSEGIVELHDVVSGRVIGRFDGTHGAAVEQLALSRDDNILAVRVGNEIAPRLYRLSDQRRLHDDGGALCAVVSVDFSTDDTRVCASSTDRRVQLWSLTGTPRRIDAQLADSVSPSATCAMPAPDRLFMSQPPSRTCEPLRGANAIAFSRDCSRAILIGHDRATLWRGAGRYSPLFALGAHVTASAAFDDSGAAAAVLESVSAKPVYNPVNASFDDGRMLVLVDADRGVERARRRMYGRGGGLAWSPADARLAVAAGLQILLLDRNGAESMHFLAPAVVRSIAISHDGNSLAAGLEDGTIRLWKIEKTAR